MLPFDRHGPAIPKSPILVTVPHAGRDYPLALRRMLAAPERVLQSLEDRHVDRVAVGATIHETLLVARRGRAWIDLNRAERERDPRIDEGAPRLPLLRGATKVRSGLGLIPRRASGSDNIWNRRLLDPEVAERIATDHRPWHETIERTLTEIRSRFGVAVLIDLHSMPPLQPRETAPRIVLGDRFGKSAGAGFMSALEAVAVATGHKVAMNTPYAGGHTLDRHGKPLRGIHAIQVEIDRTLYLDANLDGFGAGISATIALVRAMLNAVGGVCDLSAMAAE